MTEIYQIPKDQARVTLYPPGVETRVFLSRDARLHGGHETISDLLADPVPFLPTHPDEGIVLHRKDQLSWIRIHDPLENEEGFFDTSGFALRLPVRCIFADGSQLEGSLVVVAPRSASRVSDVVNSDRRWVLFEDDHGHYLVNLRRVVRIEVPEVGVSEAELPDVEFPEDEPPDAPGAPSGTSTPSS